MIRCHSIVHRRSKTRFLGYLLPLAFIPVLACLGLPVAHAAQVTFAWDPSPNPVAGYRLCYGTSDGIYPGSADAGLNTTYTLELTAPTHYIVARSYDGSGNQSAPSNQVVAHALTASAGTGGGISPTGTSYVSQGSSRTHTITPSAGYSVVDVKVDGMSVGAVSTYTFTNVTAPHSISAIFMANTTSYTITSSAGANGSISPAGSVSVPRGSNQTFSITPNSGYKISDVKVDNVSIGAISTYTFSNVTAPHSVSATFAASTISYTITSSAGANGSISPAGSVSVPRGSNQTFSITPNSGCKISDVRVDGVSVGAVSTYTFSNVTAPHTITAAFAVKNQPPIANAGPDQTVAEGKKATLSGANSTDPENGALTYSWVQLEGPSVSLSNSSSATPTFTAPDVGVGGESLSFKLTVADPGGLKSEDTCIVNVTWVNSPPTANAGPQQSVPEGTDVTLDGSGSTDPDDGIATYEWKQISGPAVNLLSGSPATVSFTAPAVESAGVSLTFELTVKDNGGLQSKATSVVNVTNSLPPRADAGADQTVYQGISVMLDGCASSDPDGSIVSYRWAQISGPPVTLSAPTMAQTQFTAPAVPLQGTALTFSLTVTDDDGMQSVDNCTVYVNNNTGPDLTGTWQSLSYSGWMASGNFQCRNQGNFRAGPFTVRFYLSDDGRIPGRLLKTASIPDMNAAESKRVSLKVSATGLSRKYILAIIDSGDAVRETNEANNCIPVVIP